MQRQDPSARPRLSFVVPARNEAAHIPRTLASIHAFAPPYSYEVIVVDNGSTDATAELARGAGATVLSSAGGTIAAVRNQGVAHARGQVLVFLDADVSLTADWQARLPHALALLDGARPAITGSHCGPPDDGGWIERNWFRQFALEQGSTHLGTGHLLIRRDLFERLGGFDESLETGEDYEFCQRAVQAGAEIVNDPALRVVHHDFPKDLPAFVRREAWHGRGDLRSWRAFLNSKVAVGAAVFLFAHLLLLLGALLPGGGRVAAAGAALLLALLLASTWKKYRHAPWAARLVNAVLFYFYYLGRSLSFAHVLQRSAGRSKAA